MNFDLRRYPSHPDEISNLVLSRCGESDSLDMPLQSLLQHPESSNTRGKYIFHIKMVETIQLVFEYLIISRPGFILKIIVLRFFF